MDKEKQIEEMTSFIALQLPVEYEIVTYYDDDYTEVNIKPDETAKNFVEAGYGNVKRAIKGFAERLKSKIADMRGIDDYQERYIDEAIDNLIKELYAKDS